MAYRLGRLIFTVEGGKRVGVVGLGLGTQVYVALNATECLGRPEGRRARSAGAQAVERLVRVGQRERLDLGPDRHRGASAEELLAVRPRRVGDRAHLPLAPEQLVRERGDVGHVDARADDRAALRHGA